MKRAAYVVALLFVHSCYYGLVYGFVSLRLQSPMSASQGKTLFLSSPSTVVEKVKPPMPEDNDAAVRNTSATTTTKQEEWRRLGSFETLLTRKAATGPTRLSIPHVSVAIIESSSALTKPELTSALVRLVQRHPLLRACIKGTGAIEDAPIAGVRRGAKEVDPFRWAPSPLTEAEIVAQALSVSEVEDADSGDSWYTTPFQQALDNTDFDLQQGPLWLLQVLSKHNRKDPPSSTTTTTALLFVFNHAISDQMSSNILIDELLATLSCSSSLSSSSSSSSNGIDGAGNELPFPPSIEDAVLAGRTPGFNTFKYLIRQAVLGALPSIILPHTHILKTQVAAAGAGRGEHGLPAETRRTICEFRRLTLSETEALVSACRQRGLTVTAALSAAMLYVSSDFAHAPEVEDTLHNYRLLLSLNMRAFSARKVDKKVNQATVDWPDNAVASAAGAMDFTTKIKAKSGISFLQQQPEQHTPFWTVARQCRQEFLDFVSADYVPESVLLFDWGFKTVEINDVVEKEADNPKTLGRAYTCGVSNMGVFTSSSSSPASTQYGPFQLHAIHYATSHSLTGSLYQLSCGTVNGALCLTLHYAWPIVDRATARNFADSLVTVLRHASKSSPSS